MDGLNTVAQIGMMLLGAFPAVALIVKYAAKPLSKVGGLLGMNEAAAGGMVATLANNIPMFQLMKDMDPRGKVLNSAFAVSAAFVLGDHLGFTAGVERSMIAPMMAGKLTAGILAVALAYFLFRRSLPAAAEHADGSGEPAVDIEPGEEPDARPPLRDDPRDMAGA